jgi:hypothetical protein
MKRERPADDIRRWAIKAHLQGLPSREIAQTLNRSPDTIKGYLGRCGHKVEGTYHLNALIAKALFSESELLALGAVWNGRCWVGHGPTGPSEAPRPAVSLPAPLMPTKERP